MMRCPRCTKSRNSGASQGPTIAAILAGVIGTIVAGMALAQVLVVTYQASSSRIKERVSVAP